MTKITTVTNTKEYKNMPSAFNNNPSGQAKKPQNQNDKKINRTTLLAVIGLLIAIVIVSAAVVASNRSKEPTNTPELPPSDQGTDKPEETPPADNNTETEPPKADTPTSTPADNKIPAFILPVSGTLSSVHDPDVQVYSNTMGDYRVHLGVDLVTSENAPVYAVADGKISKIWSDTRMGYCMAITHSGNAVSIYKNLAEKLPDGIAEGVSVRSGQLVALVGNSAMVEVGAEPHLHFEVSVNDLAVDPLKYFDEASLSTIKKDTEKE